MAIIQARTEIIKQNMMDRIDKILLSVEARNKYLRKGQYIYNECYKYYPEQVEKLTGTNVDCFYNDKYIDDFIKALRDELSLQQQRD